MKVTIEQRAGRITQYEYRAVVALGAESAAGEWCFTKRDARSHVDALRRALFDAEEAERRLTANSEDRCARIRQRLTVERRITSGIEV